MSVVALGMSAVMFCGCGLDSVFEHEPVDPAFNPNGVNNGNADVGVPKNNVQEPATEPAKSETPVETTTISKEEAAKQKRLEKAKEGNRAMEDILNKSGHSMDPNKRLGKDSNGNYVEKKCVNPYCGCVDCKCKPKCECDDR